MSTNGTDVATVCLQHLSLEAWTNRVERPANLGSHGVFACYLRTRPKGQTYRYLRAWLAANWSEASGVSYDEIALSLSEERVLASLKGKSLAEVTSIAKAAQDSQRDLSKAFKSCGEHLSQSCRGGEQSSSSKQQSAGATAKGNGSGRPIASSSPSLSSDSASQSQPPTASAKSTATGKRRPASPAANGRS